jgi:hypothetical protein
MTDEIYLLPVTDTIKSAWKKVSGTKGSFWAALIIAILILVGLGLIEKIIKTQMPSIDPAINFIFQIVNFIFEMGILYLGIRRAFDLPISYRMMFYVFQPPMIFNIIGLYILQVIIFLIPAIIIVIGVILFTKSGLLSLIGTLLSVIAIITIFYLAMRMAVSTAFVLDKKINPWQAIKKSFRATRSNVMRLIGIFLLELIIIIVSMIPLGIGLIWSLPLGLIIYGMVYKNLLINVHSE